MVPHMSKGRSNWLKYWPASLSSVRHLVGCYKLFQILYSVTVTSEDLFHTRSRNKRLCFLPLFLLRLSKILIGLKSAWRILVSAKSKKDLHLTESIFRVQQTAVQRFWPCYHTLFQCLFWVIFQIQQVNNQLIVALTSTNREGWEKILLILCCSGTAKTMNLSANSYWKDLMRFYRNTHLRSISENY